MIHLIVGNTGSGKTTYAHQLKDITNAIHFSIDQWNKTLFLPDKGPTDGLRWFLERINREEAIIMSLIEQLESVGTDSILDLGFAKFEHRKKFRAFADENGFEHTTHYLDIPTATRFQRVMNRNEEKGQSFEFEVSRDEFDFMESWFEAPDANEMRGGTIITL